MTRPYLALSGLVILAIVTAARADLARLSDAKRDALSKPADAAPVQLARLMPSYTLSFLASMNTPESIQSVAEQSQGAVHLAGNQVFYAPLAVLDAKPGGNLGPGGDDSVESIPPPGPPGPPPPSRVPSPSAFLLGVIGLTLVDQAYRRRR